VLADLRDEAAQSANIKSTVTRKNVGSALASVLARVTQYGAAPPDNGMAVFCGTIGNGHKDKLETIVIDDPLEPIPVYRYRCGSTFDTAPLEAMLISHDVYGLIVIDASESTIGILRGTHIEPVATFTSYVPSKHSRGGQSAPRFERLRTIALHEFFKKVADAANLAFVGADIKGIVVGGLSPTKDQFIKTELLHHELRKIVVGIYDTCYTNASGLDELARAARDTIMDADTRHQKDQIDRFLTELGTGTRARYGRASVCESLERGAVATLLLAAPDPVLETLAERYGSMIEYIDPKIDERLHTVFGDVAALLRY